MSAHRFLSKNKLAAGVGIGAIAMLAVAVPALSQPEGPNKGDEVFKKDEVFQVTTVMQVPGAASFFSFDISWFDPKLKKFFLADRNNKTIDVVDATQHPGAVTPFPNPGFAGVNPAGNDFSGPDGVLTANNSTELWVGDSPGKVWVMDATTGAIKTKSQMNGQDNPILVKTTGTPPVNTSTTRADELCVTNFKDPAKDNLVMIASPAEPASNGGPFVTFISTKTYKVLGHLTLAGGTGIEQCQWNPTDGMFYQNVPADPGGQDQVAVINPTTMKVDHFINIDACKGVRGMAIGPDNQILIGCTARSSDGHRNSVIINASGAVLKVLTDLGGVDEVWFNPDDGHYVLPSCNTPCRTIPGTGVTGPELLGIVDSRGFRLDHSVTIAEQNGATANTGGNPRTTHSGAAGGNLIFLPIPATGGTAPQFDPTLCDSFDDTIVRVGSPNAATGCIVVLAAKKDDHSPVAKERENDDRQD
jgi:hypothetical protein